MSPVHLVLDLKMTYPNSLALVFIFKIKPNFPCIDFIAKKIFEFFLYKSRPKFLSPEQDEQESQKLFIYYFVLPFAAMFWK